MKYINIFAKTEKIVIVDNGGEGKNKGAAKVSGYITDIMSQLPESLEAITGINVLDFLKKATDNTKTDPKTTETIVDKKEKSKK